MRFCGKPKPELVIAERTRSRASRTALSARPTIVKAGRPMRMSASTQTRRLSTPSSAKAMTRARLTSRRASERPLEVIELDERAVRVEDHADGVEPQLGRARPLVRLREPGRAHAADLLALALVERVPRRARARATRLDLAEDDRLVVGHDEVDLA